MVILCSDSNGWKPRQPKSIRTGLTAGLVKKVTSLGGGEALGKHNQPCSLSPDDPRWASVPLAPECGPPACWHGLVMHPEPTAQSAAFPYQDRRNGGYPHPHRYGETEEAEWPT